MLPSVFLVILVVAADPPAADDLPLRPIPRPEAPPAETPGLAWVALGASTIPAGILLVLLSRWLRRPRVVPPPSPSQWALSELDRIAKRAVGHDPKALRQMIEAATSVLRTYLHLQSQLPAPEQTTQEFRRVIEERQAFTPQQRARLHELLNQADLVKFAQAVMPLEEVQKYLKAVREFVVETSAANPQTQTHSR
jgi:hypothetical protein